MVPKLSDTLPENRSLNVVVARCTEKNQYHTGSLVCKMITPYSVLGSGHRHARSQFFCPVTPFRKTLQVEYRFTLLSRGLKRCHRLGDLLCTHECCPFVSLDELDKLVQHAEAARVADELDV